MIAYVEHKVSLETFIPIEAALVKHDNMLKGLFPGGYLVITHNHSKLFSVTEPTRNLSLSGKW